VIVFQNTTYYFAFVVEAQCVFMRYDENFFKYDSRNSCFSVNSDQYVTAVDSVVILRPTEPLCAWKQQQPVSNFVRMRFMRTPSFTLSLLLNVCKF